MISSEYWPPLNMDEAKWHPSMNVLSEEFQKAYGSLVFNVHFLLATPSLDEHGLNLTILNIVSLS